MVEDNKEEVKYEPTGEFLKYLEIKELEPTFDGIEEDSYGVRCRIIKAADQYYYEREENSKNDYIKELFNEYAEVSIENNNLVVSVKNGEGMQSLFWYTSYTDSIQIVYDKKYIVENVDVESIDKIFYTGYGPEVFAPLVVYLSKNDGTVQAIDLLEGCKTGIFRAYDIDSIKNIIELETLQIPGYRTMIAHTADGKIYDLSFEKYFEEMESKRNVK